MASKIQKKLQKKKQQEREDKKKIQRRREGIRSKAKEEREDYRRDKRIKRLQQDMGGLSVWADEVFKNIDDSTLAQLEHNSRIMKTLEEEYERDVRKKKELNDKLEEEGHLTLNQKLMALQQEMLEQHPDNSVRGLTIAPPRPKEVADVEVIKAPNPES